MRLDFNTLIALISAAATISTTWMVNLVRLEIAKHKLEASELREKERERLEERFMPRHEIEARLKLAEQKLGIKIT